MADFDTNMGTASLTEHPPEDAARTWPVETRRLDQYIRGSVGVLKLDVEEHELNVMLGAQEAIAQQRVRDILLEDRSVGASPKLEYLRSAGFKIFAIDKGSLGLRVAVASQPRTRRLAYDPPTFLATRAPNRALHRLSGLGWTALNPRLFARRRR